MPVPQVDQTATIVVNGREYTYWQSISVERQYGTAVSYMLFSCAEMGDTSQGWANLKLGPGDSAVGYLAGVKAITGLVDERQVFYDAGNHGVQIRVLSQSQETLAATVEGAPGQYNSSFEQIAQAARQSAGRRQESRAAFGIRIPRDARRETDRKNRR